MTKAIEITVGGRKLRQVLTSTVRHDLHLMNQIRKSGISEIIKHAEESAEEFANRLLNQLIQSQALIPVLASCFIDAERTDLDWSPESSEQLAQFLEGLTDKEDKSTVFAFAVRLVMDFFEQGVVSLRTSLSSSGQQGRDDPAQSSSQNVAH